MNTLHSVDDSAPPSKKPKTFARLVSRLSSSEDDTDITAENAKEIMDKLAKEMKHHASSNEPFTNDEISSILKSIQNVLCEHNDIDMEELSAVLKDTAHYTHKEWDRTLQSSQLLKSALLPNNTITPTFEALMERVFTEGNWYGALKHASDKPWVVLVTGLNGIRKTTSIYQPWFPQLLSQAITPTTSQELPHGGNSFFRQLDHMIAILTNEQFQNLYQMTSFQDMSKSTVDTYSSLKDAIFTRYRTLAEMMGIVLIQLAQTKNINVMVETSGRDIAMFHYINTFFSSNYNKLALHFTINDICYAESSVDTRMITEIQNGVKAVTNPVDIKKIINVNAGGPYGSHVLKGVQKDSDDVWESVVKGECDIGDGWYKASIEINGSEDGDWTACAVKSDGTKGDVFTFERI